MTKLFTVAFLIIASAAFPQELKNFKLTNVVNDQTVSLDTYPTCEGMVIVFISNTCPYDDYYRARINKIAQTYSDRVPILLVNSGVDATDAQDAMVKKAKQSGISLPYLADKDQTLMNNLGAKKSPEVFLLKNSGGKFTVVYRGAIDDNPQVEADVRQNYLRDAIDIMLSKQTIATPEVRPTGCNLKKKS
jgi:hypothetical protein